MAENSKIEWTPHTFNPWWGCVKVSEGCKNCYAESFSKRTGNLVWGPTVERRFFGEKHWAEPIKWNRDAETAGERRRVFCASMADVFEELPNDHPSSYEMYVARWKLFQLITVTPHLDWLLLTKRPENVRRLVSSASQRLDFGERSTNNWLDRWLRGDAPSNVWMGTSVENQEAADKRIPELLKVPAKVRFLSCEPLLGPVEFSNVSLRSDAVQVLGKPALAGIHWVIAGGESGPGARPMHPDWARSLREQCVAVGVAFHFKQHGEYLCLDHMTDQQWVAFAGRPDITHVWPDGDSSVKIGKKRAGRLLDGREWNEFPTP